jgi:hypothetical protein
MRSKEKRMNRTGLALMAVVLAGSASLTPAQAVPPTATPSPGYDARLQEQRAASRAAVAPVVKPRRVKKPRAH